MNSQIVQSERIILPTNDLAFKKLFGDERHKDVLTGFIRDVFGLNVMPVDLEITDSYSAAAGIIRWVNLTPKERRMADYLTRARQDRKNQDEYIREEERAIADQRVAAERAAAAERQARTVREMRAREFPVATIADLLGISEAEVEAITD